MANANGGVIMKAERCPEGNEAATHNNSAREKNLPYIPESAQHSDCKHNKGWKTSFRMGYLPATTKLSSN